MKPTPLTRGLSRGLVIGGLFAVFASTAFAQQTDGPPPGSHERMRERMEERCKADPQKCEEMKKRFEEEREKCKADPAACKQKREEFRDKMKEKREQMHEKCKADPEACKQKREDMRQKMEERCKADPQKCEEWKKNHPHHDGDRRGPPPAGAN